jgi:hypothetical protein
MTTVVDPLGLTFRMDAYPVDRDVITALPSFNRAMDLSQSLIKAENAKDLARKLGIDSGAFSCKQNGSKPWNVVEVQRSMELGQNLIPIAWLAHRYGHGLVMLETEAERRERAMREGLAERDAKIAYLEGLVTGKASHG